MISVCGVTSHDTLTARLYDYLIPVT